MSKTIIVANRLPVKLNKDASGKYGFTTSEGGLATGLHSVHKSGNNIWIGWPGVEVDAEQHSHVNNSLADQKLVPVFLTQDEINNFYEGFSNETLWPVFHYMSTYAVYDPVYWHAYQNVNKKFRDAVLEHYEPGDTIWVHDYQLLILPGYLRDARPDATIGFFNHIPFPSYELFRLIPCRKELLHGLLGSDLIGFHTYDDVRHFLSTATHLAAARSASNVLLLEERMVVVESFPMGIDPQKFEIALKSDSVRRNIKNLAANFQKVKLVVSIDRLDYSKGIKQRLQAFDEFLRTHPRAVEKIALYMVVVPSRDSVPQYKELRNEIDQLVGNINGRYRTMNWLPIHYFYQSFPFDMLVALYASADICLVTPMRDGMNLVCKEYVACRTNNDGTLILSEMAGASKELIDAIVVNPNNIQEISLALETALLMPKEEQQRRMTQMRGLIKKFNINQWAKIFMDRLKEVKDSQASMKAKHVSASTEHTIREIFSAANKRALFLDYDGTLVGFNDNPEAAVPDNELFSILESLFSDSRNEVVLISGRNYESLERWFGHLPIHLVAEHGAWYKYKDCPWKSIPGLTDAWKKDIFPLLHTYSDRTPGTFIEEKTYSLVWHYRKADEGLGELRANELMTNLKYLASDKGLQLLPGDKVIEIKNVEINKGRAVTTWLQQYQCDVMLAIGDDHTDEDIFKVLPQDAITIKVGSNISAARFYLNRFNEVRKLLRSLGTTEVINSKI
jgi:trehalose 6-phosphate synthase/phosphatase